MAEHPYDCDCDECSQVIRVYSQGEDIPEPEFPEPESAEEYREAMTDEEAVDVGEVLREVFETRPAAALADITRVEAAHKVHAEAVKRIHKVETEMRAAFEDLIKAQNLMKENGIEIVTKFSRPMDSAWAAWKNEKR